MPHGVEGTCGSNCQFGICLAAHQAVVLSSDITAENSNLVSCQADPTRAFAAGTTILHTTQSKALKQHAAKGSLLFREPGQFLT